MLRSDHCGDLGLQNEKRAVTQDPFGWYSAAFRGNAGDARVVFEGSLSVNHNQACRFDFTLL